MATFDSLCFAKSQAGGVPEKKEDQREEGVTLYCSRLRISRTNAKPSLHHVRGIVCRTHTCGLLCSASYRVSSHLTLCLSNTHYNPDSCLSVVQCGRCTAVVFASAVLLRSRPCTMCAALSAAHTRVDSDVSALYCVSHHSMLCLAPIHTTPRLLSFL